MDNQEKSLTEYFGKNKIELIKRTIAKDATNDELALFLYQARRTGLDPLARQIYFIKTKDGKVNTLTSIDGFRIIADRSGVYAGQDEPEYIEQDGKLIRCSVAVYKFSPKGERYKASVGVAYYDEYRGNTPIWNKMPHVMLSKSAESQAIRKAFPQDLSGIYTTDEIDGETTNFNTDKIIKEDIQEKSKIKSVEIQDEIQENSKPNKVEEFLVDDKIASDKQIKLLTNLMMKMVAHYPVSHTVMEIKEKIHNQKVTKEEASMLINKYLPILKGELPMNN